MGDIISLYEMKSSGRELARNQNAAFHLGNQAGVFIGRIFIPSNYDLTSHRDDLAKQASLLSYQYELDVNFYSKSISRRDYS